MDNTQKILKEMSDLTRNLDVLVKEIREMNKINSQTQKTTLKTLEDSTKKAEQSAEKAEKAIKESKEEKNPAKENSTSTKTEVEKATKEIQEKQDGMFTKFLESIKKNSEEGNEVLRKASLSSLKEANQAILKTGSIEGALKAGAVGGLKGGVGGLLGLGASLLKKDKPELKEKEKFTSDAEEKKEEKPSDLNKMNPTAEKKKEEPKSEVPSAKKDENKGFFEKLMDKFSPKKESSEEKKEAQNSTTAPAPADKGDLPKEASKKDEKKGFFASLAERINPKKEEAKPAESTALTGEKSKEEKKATAESITKSPELTEGQKIKEDVKNLYKESRLGKTISGVKSLLNKNKETKEGKSEMMKEEKTLKSPPPAPAPTPPAPDKPQPAAPAPSGSAPSGSGSTPSSTPSSTASQPSPGSPAPQSSGPATLTSEDIKDIKSLLSSINNSLKGPLVVKETKPFRPKSNMLE